MLKLDTTFQKKWDNTHNSEDLAKFHEKRNLATNLRFRYYTNLINQNSNSNNRRQLFQKAKKLLALNQHPLLPPHSNISTLTQDFSEFFTTQKQLKHNQWWGIYCLISF